MIDPVKSLWSVQETGKNVFVVGIEMVLTGFTKQKSGRFVRMARFVSKLAIVSFKKTIKQGNCDIIQDFDKDRNDSNQAITGGVRNIFLAIF